MTSVKVERISGSTLKVVVLDGEKVVAEVEASLKINSRKMMFPGYEPEYTLKGKGAKTYKKEIIQAIEEYTNRK